jgi:hypothetical protein
MTGDPDDDEDGDDHGGGHADATDEEGHRAQAQEQAGEGAVGGLPGGQLRWSCSYGASMMRRTSWAPNTRPYFLPVRSRRIPSWTSLEMALFAAG